MKIIQFLIRMYAWLLYSAYIMATKTLLEDCGGYIEFNYQYVSPSTVSPVMNRQYMKAFLSGGRVVFTYREPYGEGEEELWFTDAKTESDNKDYRHMLATLYDFLYVTNNPKKS